MKSWLWQFIAGYVKIKVEGLKLLQFINDAAAKGIRLKSAQRDSYSRITAEASWRDYRRLLALSHNRPLRVVAVSKGGLPHIGALALKRLAFTAGLLLCVAALIAANRFVLDVRVTGCAKPELERKVFAVLDAQGLRPGVGKWTLDLHKCENELMLELPEISFAAIRVNGVVATVDVVEGAPKPKLIDRDTPCDVVAGRDAVIRKVIVYEGQAKVAAGDMVKSGQVLVDGTVTLLEGVKRVHARADVYAGVWYEGRGSAPLFAEKGMKTGESAKSRAIEFAGYMLPVEEGATPPFEEYDAGEQTYYLLGPGLKGPKLNVTKYDEVYRYFDEQDFEAAREAAFLQAENSAQALLPQGAPIIDTRTDYIFDGTNIIAKVYIETQENIAVESPIR